VSFFLLGVQVVLQNISACRIYMLKSREIELTGTISLKPTNLPFSSTILTPSTGLNVSCMPPPGVMVRVDRAGARTRLTQDS